MSKPLDELLSLLQLEKLEEGLYRGASENLGLPQVYGGQVIGQALSAARYTVESDRTVHSFHSYFLYPGDPEKPIIYDVENLRDGKSFSTRRVKAIQNGRPIFYLTASYHGDAPGFEHQKPCLWFRGLKTLLPNPSSRRRLRISYQKNCKKRFVVKNRLRCVPLLSSTLEARKSGA